MNNADQLVMRAMREYSIERPAMVKAVGRHLNVLGSEGVRNAGLMIATVGIVGLAAGAVYGLQTELSILKSAGLDAMHSYRDFIANLPTGTSAKDTALFKDMSSLLRHYVGGWSELPMSGLKGAWAGAAVTVAGIGVLGVHVVGKVFGRSDLGRSDYAEDLRKLNRLVERAVETSPAAMHQFFKGGRSAEQRIANAPWYSRLAMDVPKEVVSVARLSQAINRTNYGFVRAPLGTPLAQIRNARLSVGLSNGEPGRTRVLQSERDGRALSP